MEVNFHAEDIPFPSIEIEPLSDWLRQVANKEGKSIEELNYIFCSDDYLLGINQQYLQHDFYTDIITFDHSDGDDDVSGDIYISIDRVQDNAKAFSQSFDSELHRVMAHGLLHLLGYKDKSDSEALEMRSKEEAALSLL